MSDFYTVVGKITATPTPPATIALIAAGATKRVWLHEVHIGSANASALAGTTVSVGRPTTSGTGGAAYTPVPLDAGAPAAIFTALSATTPWSAEPTQPANYIWQQSLDAVASYIWVPKAPILVAVSTRIAVRVEADNSATKVQWTTTLVVEE